MDYKEIKVAFENEFDRSIATKTIAESIRDAFAMRLVTVQRHKITPEYKTDELLEKALRAVFPRTRMIVAALPSDDSDFVHEQLGHAAAAFLEENVVGMFCPDDRIGLGSGRAVFNTITALKSFQTAADVSPIYLHSLTGSVFPRDSEMPARELLDGDTHVTLFAEHFGKETHINTIRHPIAATSRAERDRWRSETWLAEYATKVPHHVIVGLGVLHSSHRIYDAMLKSDDDNEGNAPDGAGKKPSRASKKRTDRATKKKAKIVVSSALKAVEKPVAALIQDIEAINAKYPHYFPVADVCNRFFVVSPPLSVPEAERRTIVDRLTRKVDAVNDCLLTVTKTELTKVARTVILVAGTKPKGRAIHHLLTLQLKDREKKTGIPFRVDVLCVDRDAAREILQCVHERPRSALPAAKKSSSLRPAAL